MPHMGLCIPHMGLCIPHMGLCIPHSHYLHFSSEGCNALIRTDRVANSPLEFAW